MMVSSRAAVVSALADVLFPALEDDALAAEAAGQDHIAEFLDRSAESVDFIAEKVFMWIFSCCFPSCLSMAIPPPVQCGIE
jgi:hypothetical protein